MGVKGKDLKRLGWAPGPHYRLAIAAAGDAQRDGVSKALVLVELERVRQAPEQHLDDPRYGELARALLDQRESLTAERAALSHQLRETPILCHYWGKEELDAATLEQMEIACRLPVAVRGAQMPDGHVGYGLPIGGVLAVRDAVIPYAVGVDIACRMKLSIVEAPADRLAGWRDRLKKALLNETRFGIGSGFSARERRQHAVLDDDAWRELPGSLARLRDKAWTQLGSSGSGNHFVEWGELVLDRPDLELPAGRYLALLSHSGSRGFGASVADHFTRLATEQTKLPHHARHLAWLDLASEPGRQYWIAMELAGRYASANHDLIHRHVLAAAGLAPAVQIENHHNFAWIESVGDERLIVHRKGATPAGRDVLGVIPGSMGDPGFVVRGKGQPESLNSAAHGAGRRMSRKAAKQSLTRGDQLRYLADRGVELLDGGLDESPQAYKDIRRVMAAQCDLVDPIASFHPRIVRMAPSGPAED